MAQAHCMTCKTKRDIRNPKVETVNGARGPRRMVRGTCATCGGKVSKFVK